MRPCSYRPKPGGSLLETPVINKGVATLRGSTKEMGATFSRAVVYVYNKRTANLIAIRESDESGNYEVAGLTRGMYIFAIAFDLGGNYNSVSQDRILT